MHEPLLTKTLTDLRVQILGWGIGMGLLLLLTVLLYPSIGSTYGDLMNQLPEHFLAFFGAEPSLDTLEGYLNLEFFTYAPMVLAVFAILAGTGSIISEENQGTLDILLAQPVSRLRLVASKMAGLALGNGMVVAILIAMFWVTIPFLNLEVKAGRIMGAFALLWPFLTAIAFLSVLLSLMLSSRLFAGTVVGVLLVASYILGSLANLVSELEPLRPIYLTTYYQGSNALASEVSLAYTVGLIGILLAALSLSVWLFLRRDIAIQRSVWLPIPLVAASSKSDLECT